MNMNNFRFVNLQNVDKAAMKMSRVGHTSAAGTLQTNSGFLELLGLNGLAYNLSIFPIIRNAKPIDAISLIGKMYLEATNAAHVVELGFLNPDTLTGFYLLRNGSDALTKVYSQDPLWIGTPAVVDSQAKYGDTASLWNIQIVASQDDFDGDFIFNNNVSLTVAIDGTVKIEDLAISMGLGFPFRNLDMFISTLNTTGIFGIQWMKCMDTPIEELI
jgi:hypothetical protein